MKSAEAKEFKELKTLPQEDPLGKDLEQFSPESLSIALSQRVSAGSSCFWPSQALKDTLVKLVQNTPKARNAVAVVGPLGNLLLARADRFDVSPVHTALVCATKDYSLFCF